MTRVLKGSREPRAEENQTRKARGIDGELLLHLRAIAPEDNSLRLLHIRGEALCGLVTQVANRKRTRKKSSPFRNRSLSCPASTISREFALGLSRARLYPKKISFYRLFRASTCSPQRRRSYYLTSRPERMLHND